MCVWVCVWKPALAGGCTAEVAEALRKRNEREEGEIKRERGRGEQGSLGRLASCCTEPSSNSSTAARN